MSEFSESQEAATRYFRKVYSFVAKKMGLAPTFVRVCADRIGWNLEFDDPENEERLIVLACTRARRAAVRSNEYFSYGVSCVGVSVPGIETARAIAIALARAPLKPPQAALAPVKRKPLFVRLPSLCDRGCVFCGPNHRRLSDPTLDTWADQIRADIAAGESDPEHTDWDAIEACIREGRAEHNTINWSGNDPLNSPVFERALKLAHDLGYGAMSVQSPGTQLADSDYTDHLHRLGVRVVALTCHGPNREVFDLTGGKSGAYDLFWASVENAGRLGWSVGFQVPLVATNVDVVSETVRALIPVPNSDISVFYWHPADEFADAVHSLPLGAERLALALHSVPQRGGHSWV